MGVLIGVLLVAFCWAVAVTAIILLGLAASSTGAASSTRPDVIRRGVWWGLLLITVFALLANIVVPLQSAQTTIALLVIIAVLGALGLRSLKNHERGQRVHMCLPWRVFLWAGAIGIAYLALAALGPVTNYDSGLYHLGAIRYAAEFPTIPGLANLYFPLGYGNAEFPLAALMGTTGWAEQGFRLVNGLIMVLAALELGIRCLTGDRRPGRFILAVGLTAAWIPLVALSDYWVTSPTQDSSLWIITLVAIAYFADAVNGKEHWRSDAAVATVLGVLMVLLRPTMVVFSLAMILVVLVLTWVRRSERGKATKPLALIVASTAALSFVTAAARDAVLSGWLGYPLALIPLDVSWREPDPDQYRIAILGFHRDPANMWGATDGWTWVGPWVSRLPVQWEFYALLVLILAAVVVLILGARRGVMTGSWRSLMTVATPIAIGLFAWWAFSPPSFRFAWGIVFGLPIAAIGWVWARGSTVSPVGYDVLSRTAVTASAIVLMAVTGFSALTRFDWGSLTSTTEWSAGVSVTVPIAPVTSVSVRTVRLDSGLEVIAPEDSEQCWERWPLCTPSVSPSVRFRGEGVREGFLPG
jgi:hypothetical protein